MQKWTNKFQFPKDNYVLRCTEESLENSKRSGAPMIRYEFELVSPEAIEVAGVPMEVVGQKLWNYVTLKSMSDGVVDADKTATCQKMAKEFWEKMGIDVTTVDFDNPPLGLKGKCVNVTMYGKKEVQRKSLTKAELDAGKTEGEVLLIPGTNEPQIKYQPTVETWWNLAPSDPTKPY